MFDGYCYLTQQLFVWACDDVCLLFNYLKKLWTDFDKT